MATGVSVSGGTTGNSVIDTELYGTKWNSTSLTYSFPQDAALTSYVSGYAISPDGAHVSGLTGTQQLTVKAALAAWSAVSGLTFTEAASPSASDISIYWYLPPIVLDEYGNMVSGNPTAQVVDFPGSTQEAGDIQLGTYVVSGAVASWDAGNYPYLTILHEIGHALGLKHPHDEINGFPAAEADADSIQMSVMSYRSFPGGEVTGYTIPSGSFPVGLMPNDIAAIQYLYGANWATRSENTTYTFNPNDEVVLKTYWDGGGTDTYNFSNYTTNLSINLSPGAWSDLGSQYAATEYMLEDDAVVPTSCFGANVANPFLYDNDPRSLIENATGGSGNDTLTGNQADNVLTGNGGSDVLIGGTGNDTLTGGNGDDIFQFTVTGNGTDLITDLTFGDRIRVTGRDFSAGTVTEGDGSLVGANSVQIAWSNGTMTFYIDTDGIADAAELQITATPSYYSTSNFSLSGEDIVPVCFLRGTRIRTERGDVPIEDLAIGDRVLTLRNGFQPIKWIGRRRLRAADLRTPEERERHLPIRIQRDAILDQMPCRDLYLSPCHSLILFHGFIPAGQLVNGTTIVQHSAIDEIEYFHIELPEFDGIFAEHMLAESYVDTGNRSRYDNAEEFYRLYPDEPRIPEGECVVQEPDPVPLARARAHIEERARRFALNTAA